jgi:5-methylcytosine-specific restriction protein A
MPKRLEFFQRDKKLPRHEGRPNSHRRGYGGKAWEALRLECFKRDNWQCRACPRICGNRKEAHCDHIVPKAQGGQDRLDNLQTLCSKCHREKTSRGL